MFRTDKTLERELFAFTPRDLVDQNSDVFLFVDLFDTLDLSAFYNDYSPIGQDSVDPKLMLRTIFYGLTHGIATGRKLDSACNVDLRFIVLCGGHKPSYRTFSRFLQRHQSRIELMFVQIVRVAQRMGLASLGQVAIDGTRIKGHTSANRTIKAEKLDRAIVAITSELEALRKDLEEMNHGETNADLFSIPKEIKSREERLDQIRKASERLKRESVEKNTPINPDSQVSLNDPDARGLGSKKEKFVMGYNCQAIADADNQIILAAEICDNTNDTVAFEGVVDAMIQNCEKVPEKILADAGYSSVANLAKAEQVGSEPIFSLSKENDKFRLESVMPNEDGSTYSCMAGHLLNGKPKEDNSLSFRVTVPLKKCESCPLKDHCYLYMNKKKKLKILTQPQREIMLRQIIKSRTKEFKQIYSRRKAIIEPVFANLKTNKRLNLYRVGRANASSWWKMVCTALNIEKIVRAQRLKLSTI